MIERARAPVRYDEPRSYTVYVALGDGEIHPAANLLLLTDNRGRHRQSGLEYVDHWYDLEQAAFDLNPIHAPRRHRTREWESRGDIPAVIDEVMPGAWERALMARAWQREGRGPADIQDIHAVLHEPHTTLRVGAMAIVPAHWDRSELGALRSPFTLEDLGPLAHETFRIEDHQDIELEVLRRFQAGTTVGGARPKVLIRDGDDDAIVKFNRRTDSFNHARIEHACLEFARRCGLRVPDAEVIQIRELEALKVARFDTTADGGRRHMISANALLKDPETCADALHSSYDDLVRVVVEYSDQPTEDLRQLYTQMLVNVAINNHDDHLRNFSFLRGDRGFTLSPAYDLVVTGELGGYPFLALGNRPVHPNPGTAGAIEAREIFRLQPREARAINDTMRAACESFPEILQASGVSERDQRMMSRVCPALR